MTGNQLARAVFKLKGKVEVPMLMPNDVAYVYAEKKDLIQLLNQIGDKETNMKLASMSEDIARLSLEE